MLSPIGHELTRHRKQLAKACGKYLLACRMPVWPKNQARRVEQTGRYTVFKDNLHAKELIVGDVSGAPATSYATTPKRPNASKTHRQATVALLEEQTQCHADKSATAQWLLNC